MDTYIGIRRVEARPATKGQYNNLMGFDEGKTCESETPGFILTDIIPGGQNSCASWLPTDIFHANFRPIGITGMCFEEALTKLKTGQRVARRSWADSRYILFVPPVNDTITLSYYFGDCDIHSYRVIPWIPTTDDLLANDWYLAVDRQELRPST